jgi:hypothetical protein
MKIEFTKITHKNYRLRCISNLNVLFDKTLESKDYLKHDLIHFVFEKELEREFSFFGKIKNSDLSTNKKYFHDDSQILSTEIGVGIIQGIISSNKSDIDYEEVVSNINMYCLVQNQPSIKNLEHLKLATIINKIKKYLILWDLLKTGTDDNCKLIFEF